LTIGLIDILKLAGFDDTLPWKLVRHQHSRYPTDELLRRDWIELYQRYQGKPVFHNIRQIASFYGMPGTRAGFYGIYTVLGHSPASKSPVIDTCPWSKEWRRDSRFIYRLERDSRFDDLRHRIIIEWGSAPRSWIQKPANKEVLEIQAPGRRLPPFEDYLEFSLTYHQLRDLFKNAEAHRDWQARLSAVGGIYLILDGTSGDMYVGSASGEGGFWRRWRQYAKTGHGGNVLLKKLLDRDPSRARNFRFSVLQILPKTMAKDEILGRESKYKTKLGSRAKGLNRN
jgi:hypothetical protein